jgi:hypothetical protein
MHEIVFMPFAAPDKAIIFHYPHYFSRIAFLFGMRVDPGPAPVWSYLDAKINGNAV